MMNTIFDNTGFFWVRYSDYELKAADDGQRYVTPVLESKLTPYDPMANAETMIIDALNVGLLCLERKENDKTQTSVLEFVSKYGLLGFMTALPTTPDFMQYDTTYIPHNHFIKVESMPSHDYAMLFFPFERPDLRKSSGELELNITDNNELVALTMVSDKLPLSLSMNYLRDYAEPYDWLVTAFRDLAFTFYSSFMYYEEYDDIDENTRNAYRFGMSAFGGIAPSYRIILRDKPTLVWEFFSLLRSMQLMYSFMLTNDKKPIRSCKHCDKAFIACRANAAFCSAECKNQYNVQKSRDNDKQ